MAVDRTVRLGLDQVFKDVRPGGPAFHFAEIRVVPEEDEFAIMFPYLVLDLPAQGEGFGNVQLLVPSKGDIHHQQRTLHEIEGFPLQDIKYREWLAGPAAETGFRRVSRGAVLADPGRRQTPPGFRHGKTEIVLA